uniref:Uncharacterized protein n=1 Tax=Ixodes scapularis TaxID=6945 RepID=A0A4D5RCN5_IXOSC
MNLALFQNHVMFMVLYPDGFLLGAEAVHHLQPGVPRRCVSHLLQRHGKLHLLPVRQLQLGDLRAWHVDARQQQQQRSEPTTRQGAVMTEWTCDQTPRSDFLSCKVGT